MMFEQISYYLHFSSANKSLLQALIILAIFVTLLIMSILYYSWRKRKIEFKHFEFLLKDRNISKEEMKRLFSYLKQHNIEYHLLLENEHVMHQAVKACGLDVEKIREKLGFDTSSLIKHYIERQKELRKKWNGH